MVKTAALRLEIDARQMQQGAEQAARALDTVGQKAEKTGRQINVSTGAIERKLDAIVDGIAAQNRMIEESGRKTQEQLKETDRALGQTQTQVGKLGGEVSKTTGIMASMEQKFSALGKAAVGMFAADLGARVLGFASAMDVLNKASQAVADAITTAAKALAGMGDEYDRNVRAAERLRELTVRAKLEEEGKSLVVNYGDFSGRSITPGFTTNFTPYLANPAELNAAILAYDNSLQAIKRLEDRYSTLTSSQFQVGEMTQGPQIRADIKAIIDSLAASINDAVDKVRAFEAAEKARAQSERDSAQAAARAAANRAATAEAAAAAAEEKARIEFVGGAPSDLRGTMAEQAQTELLRRPLSPLPELPPQEASLREATKTATSDYDAWIASAPTLPTTPPSWSATIGRELAFGGTDLRGTMAEQAQTDYLRRIAINTQSTRQQFGYGYGIPEETFQPQLVPTMGGILGDETPTVPFYEQGRGAQAPAPPSKWEQQYSVQNIADSTAQQFYGALKNSLMTGDFSDFGRQVTAMIGSSLIDALIAAPFQEAMSALVQALLAGIRGGLGISPAPAGGAPAQANQYRAATASTSNAAYRSQRQQFDDASRRRIV